MKRMRMSVRMNRERDMARVREREMHVLHTNNSWY